jgi:hypothetical protein
VQEREGGRQTGYQVILRLSKPPFVGRGDRRATEAEAIECGERYGRRGTDWQVFPVEDAQGDSALVQAKRYWGLE